MNHKIQSGKVTDLTKDYRGWLMGSFVEDSSPMHTDDFEVKWVERKKGESKESAKSHPVPIRTLGVLISGAIKYELLESGETITLNNSGEYIFYEPFEEHRVTALEDSVLIVIRWKS